MTADIYSEHALVFKAFCDETRLRVLELLRTGEKCACVLLEKVNVGQSTLSHHLKIMIRSGVVSARREGKWIYYSLSGEGRQRALELLRELTEVTLTEGPDDNDRLCR
ncbi:MAG: metalloregulator ArsR/SmtB family transcription factor [Deltaproteobacteria bacterium]|jgi:ArsR family transcriptional regulator|nr:metalloregulator ArsR/SmtB family transcription factor [Deltaproteobacteria bacterium]